MKKQLLKSMLMAVVGVGMVAGIASAVQVSVTYTGDNIIDTFYLQNGANAGNLAAGVNRANWQLADTATVNVIGGNSYSFIWEVTNDGPMSNNNPGGFLGEIDFGGATNLFSNITWEYAIRTSPSTMPTNDFNDPDWNWQAVASWGNNGGTNIWTTVHGGAIAGIGTDAEWIWSPNNFKTDGTGDQWIFVRADFTAVPEPATMLLFGTGIAGLAAVARRRKTN